jgi:tRNA(fMet)-specific endonuclease VapC
VLRYLLDTDICIYVMKSRPPHLRARFNGVEGQLAISSITLAELNYGAENSARPTDNLLVIEQFAARMAVLPFAEKAAAHYGQIRAELKRAGQPVGPFDMLMGAHARSEGLVLVTNNLREFQKISGLRVENWV